MNIEEAKEYIRMMIRKQEMPDNAKALGYVYATEAIETVLSELEKKDKIIDLMAEDILKLDIEKSKNEYDHARMWDTAEGIKQYYIKKEF